MNRKMGLYTSPRSVMRSVDPPGAGAIARVFLNNFEVKGLPTQPTPVDGRSD